MNIEERQTPITDAACASIDLDAEGYPPRTYAALLKLSECSRGIERDLGEAKHKLFVCNFPKEQATNCAKCGKYKHTPWKEDDIGFICATCLVLVKDEQISKWKAVAGRLAGRGSHSAACNMRIENGPCTCGFEDAANEFKELLKGNQEET